MTFAAWSDTFAKGREEDEVLVEWLKYRLTNLSTEEKRAAVRRLLGEFGYTVRGLSDALGLPYTTVRYLGASDAYLNKERGRARRLPRVPTTRVLKVVDAWQERAQHGLTADEAARLLGELRALAPTGGKA